VTFLARLVKLKKIAYNCGNFYSANSLD